MSAEDDLALALKAMKVIRHDIRNLLASVTIIAGKLEKVEDERLRRAGPMLLDAMERTVEMSAAAQSLVEVREASPASLALEDAVRGAAESLEPPVPFAAQGLGGLTVKADPAHLRLALAALIDNAQRAGGPVAVSAEEGGGEVRILVADQGGGIPDYALPTLFTPFEGAKRRGGAGLGLPLACRVAQAQGGRAELVRKGEDGTVVALVLPVG